MADIVTFPVPPAGDRTLENLTAVINGSRLDDVTLVALVIKALLDTIPKPSTPRLIEISLAAFTRKDKPK